MPGVLIAVAQTPTVPLDVERNVARHAAAVAAAARQGARVVVFPELSLTGYEPAGIAADPSVVLAADDARLAPLRAVCRDSGVTAVVGAPTRRDGSLHLSALAVRPAGPVVVHDKQKLFGDEPSVFAAGSRPVRLVVDDREFALGICADLSDDDQAERAAGTDGWLVGVLLSREGYAADAARAAEVSRRHGIPVVLANHSGPTGGWVGAGGSGVWEPDGSSRHAEGELTVLPVGAERVPRSLDGRRAGQ